jgi:hypothetical protein
MAPRFVAKAQNLYKKQISTTDVLLVLQLKKPTYIIEMASMYALSSSRPRASRSLAPQMSQIEMDVKNALHRMMFAIGNGDIATYRQIVDVEFPKQLKPRMSTSYHKLLKEYIHPRDGSDFQDALRAAYYPTIDSLITLQEKWIKYIMEFVH